MATFIHALSKTLLTRILSDKYLDYIDISQTHQGKHYKQQAAIARLVCRYWKDVIGDRSEFYATTCSFTLYLDGWIAPVNTLWRRCLQANSALDVDVALYPHGNIDIDYTGSIIHQVHLLELFGWMEKCNSQLRTLSLEAMSASGWLGFIDLLEHVAILRPLHQTLSSWQSGELLSQITGFQARYFDQSLMLVEKIQLQQPVFLYGDDAENHNIGLSLQHVRSLEIGSYSFDDTEPLLRFFSTSLLPRRSLQCLAIKLRGKSQQDENFLRNLEPPLFRKLPHLRMLTVDASWHSILNLLIGVRTPNLLHKLHLTVRKHEYRFSLSNTIFILPALSELILHIDADYNAYRQVMSHLSLPDLRRMRIVIRDSKRTSPIQDLSNSNGGACLPCLSHLELEMIGSDAISVLRSLDVSNVRTLKFIMAQPEGDRDLYWGGSTSAKAFLPSLVSLVLDIQTSKPWDTIGGPLLGAVKSDNSKYSDSTHDLPLRLLSYLELSRLNLLEIHHATPRFAASRENHDAIVLPLLHDFFCEMSPYAMAEFLQQIEAPFLTKLNAQLTDCKQVDEELQDIFFRLDLSDIVFPNIESLSFAGYKGIDDPGKPLFLHRLFRQLSGASLHHVELTDAFKSWAHICRTQEERTLGIRAITINISSSGEWNCYAAQLPNLPCLQALRIVIHINNEVDSDTLSLSPLYTPTKDDLSSTPLPFLSTLQLIWQGKDEMNLNVRMELRELVIVRNKFGNRLKRLEVYPPLSRFLDIFDGCPDHFVQCTDCFVQHERPFDFQPILTYTE